MILIILYVCLLPTLFVMCEKDSEALLKGNYGPVHEEQFGEETAFVQEISFSANKFSIVGDLRTPVEGELHPVIIMVHGSGSASRNGAVPFEPLIEIFLRNGFAVLSWDTPGSGESEGTFSNEFRITERALIIEEAVRVMIDNPSIDNSAIGLWGISQAGWVMPKAVSLTDDIGFMIVVSGGGEDGIDQYAYQVAQVASCAGESSEEVENAEKYWSQMAKATIYTEYREAVDILVQIPSIVDYTGLTVTAENNWNPWPPYIDAFYDPMDDVKQLSIPVLVFFGEHDKNIDPVQGALAYEIALEEAGNEEYRIEILQGAGHVLAPAKTGCMNEFVSSEYVSEYIEILDDWISNL